MIPGYGELAQALWGSMEPSTSPTAAPGNVWVWKALDEMLWNQPPPKAMTITMSEELYRRLRKALQRAPRRHWQISQKERAHIKRHRRELAKVRTASFYRT